MFFKRKSNSASIKYRVGFPRLGNKIDEDLDRIERYYNVSINKDNLKNLILLLQLIESNSIPKEELFKKIPSIGDIEFLRIYKFLQGDKKAIENLLTRNCWKVPDEQEENYIIYIQNATKKSLNQRIIRLKEKLEALTESADRAPTERGGQKTILH